MEQFQFQAFDKKELIEKLKAELPEYGVRKAPLGSAIFVEKAKVTLTRRVEVVANPKSGKVSIRTGMDMLIIYVLFCWPIALYIYLKRGKTQAIKEDVAEKLKEILG